MSANMDPHLWDSDADGRPVLRGLSFEETRELAAVAAFIADFHTTLEEMRVQAQAAIARREELLGKAAFAALEAPQRRAH